MSEARLDVVDTQGFRLAFVALGPAYFAGRLQKLQVVKRSARRKSLRRNATIVAPRVRVILMRAKRAEDLLVVSHGARTRKGAHSHANQRKDPPNRLPPVCRDRRVRVAPPLRVAWGKSRHESPSSDEREPGQDRAVDTGQGSEDQTCVTKTRQFADTN